MTKKLLCTLVLATAGIFAPMKASDSENLKIEYVRNTYYQEKYEKSKLREFLNAIEEKDWEKDKIWKIISSYYRSVETIPEKYSKNKIPDYITKKYVRSLIRVESTDFPKAKSHCGARGLGQIMKGTWYNVEKQNYEDNVFIPEKNIPVTIKCLISADNFCRKKHPAWNELSDGEKLEMISACYNAGPYGAEKANWEISKMPKETRLYIPKINRTMNEISPSN